MILNFLLEIKSIALTILLSDFARVLVLDPVRELLLEPARPVRELLLEPVREPLLELARPDLLLDLLLLGSLNFFMCIL